MIAISAFAKYIDMFPANNELLVLIEHGPDIDESKALVQKLGINERVICWKKGKTRDRRDCKRFRTDIGRIYIR